MSWCFCYKHYILLFLGTCIFFSRQNDHEFFMSSSWTWNGTVEEAQASWTNFMKLRIIKLLLNLDSLELLMSGTCTWKDTVFNNVWTQILYCISFINKVTKESLLKQFITWCYIIRYVGIHKMIQVTTLSCSGK